MGNLAKLVVAVPAATIIALWLGQLGDDKRVDIDPADGVQAGGMAIILDGSGGGRVEAPINEQQIPSVSEESAVRAAAPLSSHATARVGPADKGVEAVPSSTIAVTFLVPEEHASGTVDYRMVGDLGEPLSVAVQEGSARVRLNQGHWIASYVTAERAFGPATTFEVAEESSDVALAGPGLFESFFVVVDQATHTILPGSTGRVVRTDLENLKGGKVEDGLQQVVSDGAGVMRFDGLPFGELEFSVNREGYAGQTFSLTFPGNFRDQIASTGRVDLGELALFPLTPFPIQLLGYEDWGSAQGFSVAHTHEGDRVYFDASGHALLQLGWYSKPLYLKWWWPNDEQEAIAYLDGGMPLPGEPWIIDVGRARDLEVDLRISAEVLGQLDLSQASVRVVSGNERGDAVLRGLEVSGPGVYTIRGTSGHSAMVEFAAMLEEDVVSLALEKIALRDDGRTACILNVDRLPYRVHVTDADGVPVPFAHLELRELDNATTWSFGADADELGKLEIALPSHLDLSMRVYGPDPEIMSIDRRVQAPASGDDLFIKLAASAPTSIRVLLDGVPVSDRTLELFGAHSSNSFMRLTAGERGRTKPLQVTDDSNARARLVDQTVWTVGPFINLRPGMNEIRAYTLGTLLLTGSMTLDAITHQVEGGSLEQWVRLGMVRIPDEAQRRFEVPTGTYEITRADGSVAEIHVRSGEVTRVN